MKMRKIHPRLKVAKIALATLLIVPFQVIVLFFTKGRISYYLPQLWDKLVAQAFDLKIEVVGKPCTDGQILFLGNHLSHFDIFALGSYVRASFVAKNDLESSPVIKFLSNMNQAGFISRASGQAAQASHNVRAMLEKGKNVIIFPEGTSTRGETVLDFKSSLFALPVAFADKGLRIQPFTIVLLDVDGKPADMKELRDLYAWDRDNPIELGPHIWNFAHTAGARLQIVFHAPLSISPGEDRKVLARRVREIVAAPLEQNHAPV